MKSYESIRQYVYGGLIAWFSSAVVVQWLHYFHAGDHLRFAISGIAGVAGIVGGVFFAQFGLAIGLVLGGVANLIYGTYVFWGRMDAVVRFGLGVTVLGLLGYVVMYKFMMKK